MPAAFWLILAFIGLLCIGPVAIFAMKFVHWRLKKMGVNVLTAKQKRLLLKRYTGHKLVKPLEQTMSGSRKRKRRTTLKKKTSR